MMSLSVRIPFSSTQPYQGNAGCMYVCMYVCVSENGFQNSFIFCAVHLSLVFNNLSDCIGDGLGDDSKP